MKRKMIAKVLALGVMALVLSVTIPALFDITAAMLRLQALQIGDVIYLLVVAALTSWMLANVIIIASELKKELAGNRDIGE